MRFGFAECIPGHACVELRDIDLVIPSQNPKEFVETVKKELDEKIIDVANELGKYTPLRSGPPWKRPSQTGFSGEHPTCYS